MSRGRDNSHLCDGGVPYNGNVSLTILQNDLADPTPEQLVAAFRSLPRLTDLDAHRRAEDACGVIAERLEEDEAPLLLAALAGQGVAASIVEDDEAPVLATPYRVREAHPDDDELLLFDAHNNAVRVAWPSVTLIAAGLIGRTDIHTQVSTHLQRVGYAILAHQDRRTTENRKMRPFIEVYLHAAPHRVRFEIDNFRFTYLVNTAPQSLLDRYARLVTDLAARATEAQVNRGVDAVVRGLPPRAYRSMQVFEREVRWLLWLTRLTKGTH